MYDSTYFETKLTTGTYLGDPYIVSAEYGLLELDDRIDPYDTTLHDFSDIERSSWASSVVKHLPDAVTEVVLLAGSVYREPIEMVLGERLPNVEVASPFEDTSGIGEQMSVCNDLQIDARMGNGPEL